MPGFPLTVANKVVTTDATGHWTVSGVPVGGGAQILIDTVSYHTGSYHGDPLPDVVPPGLVGGGSVLVAVGMPDVVVQLPPVATQTVQVLDYLGNEVPGAHVGGFVESDYTTVIALTYGAVGTVTVDRLEMPF